MIVFAAACLAGPQSSYAQSRQIERSPQIVQSQNLLLAQSQQEMNRDARERYDKADAELNKVYKKLIAGIVKEQKNALTDAQLAWIKFRDANCACWASPNKGGSIYPLIYYGRMKTMTEERTAELRELMKELGDM
jgi:uncharacterized protein YecT (DUF1311 family)